MQPSAISTPPTVACRGSVATGTVRRAEIDHLDDAVHLLQGRDVGRDVVVGAARRTSPRARAASRCPCAATWSRRAAGRCCARRRSRTPRTRRARRGSPRRAGRARPRRSGRRRAGTASTRARASSVAPAVTSTPAASAIAKASASTPFAALQAPRTRGHEVRPATLRMRAGAAASSVIRPPSSSASRCAPSPATAGSRLVTTIVLPCGALLGEQRAERAGVARRELGRRLVRDQQRRLAPRERSRDAHPAPLGGRQRHREPVAQLRDARPLERLARGTPGLCRQRAGDVERQRHVLLDGQIGDQQRLLRDEADAPPVRREDLRRAAAEHQVVDHDPAVRGLLETEQETQQRGLAGCRRPVDHQRLAGVDAQAHVDQDLALRVRPGNVNEPHHRPRPPMPRVDRVILIRERTATARTSATRAPGVLTSRGRRC